MGHFTESVSRVQNNRQKIMMIGQEIQRLLEVNTESLPHGYRWLRRSGLRPKSVVKISPHSSRIWSLPHLWFWHKNVSLKSLPTRSALCWPKSRVHLSCTYMYCGKRSHTKSGLISHIQVHQRPLVIKRRLWSSLVKDEHYTYCFEVTDM